MPLGKVEQEKLIQPGAFLFIRCLALVAFGGICPGVSRRSLLARGRQHPTPCGTSARLERG